MLLIYFLSFLLSVGSVPTFPLNWKSDINGIIDSGGNVQLVNGTFGFMSGLEGNKSALVTPYQTNIMDYDDQYIYFLQYDECQCWCPDSDEQCNDVLSLCNDDYLMSGKFIDNEIYKGQYASRFDWNDTLSIFPMVESSLWIDVEKNIPLGTSRKIMPFGEFQGWINATYMNYKPNSVTKEMFQVPGEQYCQQCDDVVCNDYQSSKKRLLYLLKLF